MPTRVLFIFPATYLSPPWTVTAQIIRNVDRSRFACYAAVDREVDEDLGIGDRAHVEKLSLGGDIARARRGDVAAAGRVSRSMARLVALARRERVQIVHATDDGIAMTMAYAVCRATGAKLLVHHHAQPSMYRGARLAFTRAMVRAAACNLGVSRFIAEDISAVGGAPERVTFVLNGVDTAFFRPEVDGTRMRAEYGIGASDVLVFQMSRLWQPKRQIDFVRAMGIAVREEPRLRGLIVGWEDPRYDGPFGSYKEELLAACREERLGDRMLLSEARPEAEQLHAAADIFVMPAVNEPFGLVVVEAMATARPVVAARSGALPEIIEDGVSGFLVPPRSPERIAEALVRLARDPALRQRVGGAARAHMEGVFREQRVGEQVSAVYDAMVRGGPLPRF